MKRVIPYAAIVLLLCVLAACAKTTGTARVFAMDTVMELTFHGAGAQSAVSRAENTIHELEQLFSRTREDGAVGTLNRTWGTPVTVGKSVCRLLEAAAEYSAATGGAFDVTVAPVVDAWGFGGEEHRVPAQDELEALLCRVGMSGVQILDEETVLLEQGVRVDLGGIAKGCAADGVEDILRQEGVTSGLAALGGNIYAHGSKPDGAPWRIGVQDPQNPDSHIGVLRLTDAYAVTSGGYQRYFSAGGEVYHHIIDPATGRPANNGLRSVTVVAPANGAAENVPGNGTMCDAFSTALFVMGQEAALEFWRAGKYTFDLILVTDSGRVLITQGLSECFEKNGESGYLYEIVEN